MTSRRLKLTEVTKAYRETGYVPAPGVNKEKNRCGFMVIEDYEVFNQGKRQREFINEFGNSYMSGFMDGFDSSYNFDVMFNESFSSDAARYKEGYEDGSRIGEQIQTLERLKGAEREEFALARMHQNISRMINQKYDINADERNLYE